MLGFASTAGPIASTTKLSALSGRAHMSGRALRRGRAGRARSNTSGGLTRGRKGIVGRELGDAALLGRAARPALVIADAHGTGQLSIGRHGYLPASIENHRGSAVALVQNHRVGFTAAQGQ